MTAGEGLFKSPDMAYTNFKKAADQGLMQAVFKLGQCYEDGWGVPKDDAQAGIFTLNIPALLFKGLPFEALARCV